MLFDPYSLRGLTLRNRIVMSPMCMYSAGADGRATDWHLVHYATRAVGGVGLIIQEATAVEPRGRISEADLGLWDDVQIEPLARMVRLCHAQGAAMGVQLAHAGRKAWSPKFGQGPEQPVAPSAVPQGAEWVTPRALAVPELDAIVGAWVAAARRAEQAGYDLIEIHAAHGYLLHEFLSLLANQRSDEYGGTLENRMRLLLRVVRGVRAVWPESKPLFVRLSCSDWHPDGLRIEDAVQVACALRELRVDVVDCSSGGIAAPKPEDIFPGYQVTFAERVRREAGLPTQAIGMILTPQQAEQILRLGQADLIALGRELLRTPYWPLRAARELGVEIEWPRQYVRAKPN